MCRVLVVDDEDDVRYFLRSSLGLDGHEVHTVGDLFAMANEIEDFLPQVIILDIFLKGERGDSILSSLTDAAVIIMSGSETTKPEKRAELMDKGALYVVTKPVNVKELSAMVRKSARHQTANRTMRSAEQLIDGSLLEQLKNTTDMMVMSRRKLHATSGI
jgi:DNA-binding response OmpR family regulator